MHIGLRRKASGILAGLMIATAGSGCTNAGLQQESSSTRTSGSETAESAAPVATTPTGTTAAESEAVETEVPATVVLEADGDMNADGFLDHASLSVDAAGAVFLTLVPDPASGIASVSREVSGPGGSDFADVNRASEMRILRIFDDPAAFPVISLQFDGGSVGDAQLCLYSYSPTEGLVLEKAEIYAVDTGTVTLSDREGDGLYERNVEKDYVSSRHRYVREGSQLGLLFLDATGKVAFDRKKPEEVIRCYLFRRFNGIAGMTDDILMPGTAEPERIFIPYPSATGEYLGIAFADATRDSYMGMPSGEIAILSSDDRKAICRVSDVSDYSDRQAAAIRFSLEIQADGTWRIVGIETETSVPVCVAEDLDNTTAFVYTPVFMNRAEIAAGCAPMRDKLKELTGTAIDRIELDGDRCTADLAAGMDLYINQGSTGAHLRIESLVRTLLALPGVMETEIRIAGRERVEMDHYSFNGIYSLTDDGMLRFDPWAELEVLPTDADGAASRVLQALHEKDLVTLSRLADPEAGVRLSIRWRVRPAIDPVCDRSELLSYQFDPAKGLFYAQPDGTGGIRGTKQQLFTRFFEVTQDPALCRIIALPAVEGQWMMGPEVPADAAGSAKETAPRTAAASGTGTDKPDTVAAGSGQKMDEASDATTAEAEKADIPSGKGWATVAGEESAATVYADCARYLIAVYDGNPDESNPSRTLQIALKKNESGYRLVGIVSDDP